MIAKTWEFHSQAEIESTLERTDNKPTVCFSRLCISDAGLHPVANAGHKL